MRSSLLILIMVFVVSMLESWDAAAGPKEVAPLVPDPAETAKPCQNSDLKFQSPAIRERFYSDSENFSFLFFWVKKAYNNRFDEGYCTDWKLGVSSWQKANGNSVTATFGLTELNQVLASRGLPPVSEEAIRTTSGARTQVDGKRATRPP